MNSIMSNPNSKSAGSARTLRRLLGLFALLALVSSVAGAGSGQSSIGSKGSISNGQGAVTAQHQSLDSGNDLSSGPYDSLLMEKRMKMLNNERHKALVSDSDKLFKLATELNNDIARNNSGSLTGEQIHKIAEIEKLAHSVRDKMTMTINAPNPNYFPTPGIP
jgi:hypothetical protein